MKTQTSATDNGGYLKMLLTESKVRTLENFYALDYVFFGKPLAKMESCCPILKEEYLSVKGALMTVFIEMMKLTDHTPRELDRKVNRKGLMENARSWAKIARANAQKIVVSEQSRKDIKAEIKEAVTENTKLDPTKLVEEKIREKAFRLAVDNLLIARLLSESIDPSAMNSWEGQIVEDSYKILRDGLCEAAIALLDG